MTEEAGFCAASSAGVGITFEALMRRVSPPVQTAAVLAALSAHPTGRLR